MVGSASISHKVNTSLDVNNPVDLIASSGTRSIPDRVVRDITGIDGVAASAALPTAKATVSGQDVTVLGADHAALGIVRGTPDYADLRADQIVLPSSSDLVPVDEVGDVASSVVLRIGGRERRMSVVLADGIGIRPLVSTAVLEQLGARLGGTGAVWVRAADGANPREVTAAVNGIAATSDLEVAGGLLDRADVAKVLSVVLSVTVGLLAVAVLIALIGVGNTLSLSVLERVRENSLLRALGLSRAELRGMLAVEALLMAGVSAVLGVALGTAYAWFGVKTTAVGVFRTAPGLTIPWGQIGLILLVAALAGLAACVLPARRAARVSPSAGLVAD